ncbi:MAG: PASTA domain-containing protein [Bacteroidetes bacterium]|nr:PASTA domain-containing protein [Bacteroidota bacterium]
MSYGYETKLTPLQTLTFYNAVANNGRMVKPIFVQEIRKQGKLIHTYETEVVNAKICSDATLKQAREMMEGVVLRGTATNLKFDTYTVAGKTGTAKMAFGKSGYSLSDSVRYQSSFCGYFPADKPLYSCIVVMYDLSPKFYYGNVAAGPVFKEIADKVYSTSIAMHNEIKTDSLINKKQPEYKGGDITALNKVLQSVNKKPVENKNKFYASVNNNTSGVSVNLFNGLVPDVAGMPMRDAIYILESTGMYVTPVGKGVVKKQSVQAGTPIVKGKKIIIELS